MTEKERFIEQKIKIMEKKSKYIDEVTMTEEELDAFIKCHGIEKAIEHFDKVEENIKKMDEMIEEIDGMIAYRQRIEDKMAKFK